MTINFSIQVPDSKLGETFQQLSKIFGFVETTSTAEPPIDTTVDPKVEYAVKTARKAEKKVETAVAPKPSYSITAIRAKAKEVAEVRGKSFIKDALESVGSKTVSNIPEEKFDEFMDYLNSESNE